MTFEEWWSKQGLRHQVAKEHAYYIWDAAQIEAALKICDLLLKWGRLECSTRGVDPDIPVFDNDYDHIALIGIHKLAFAEISVDAIRQEFGLPQLSRAKLAKKQTINESVDDIERLQNYISELSKLLQDIQQYYMADFRRYCQLPNDNTRKEVITMAKKPKGPKAKGPKPKC